MDTPAMPPIAGPSGPAASSTLPVAGGPVGYPPLATVPVAAGLGSGANLLETGRPPEPPRRKRFSEPQKFLPVAFVVLVICFLFWSYLWNHIIPLLQREGRGLGPEGKVDESVRQRAWVELAIFLPVTMMLVICYVRSILVHPGAIPENDPQWEYSADGRTNPDFVPMALQEMKKTGERRHCKWCGKYKPDRCHHCRVCKSCILKMDHHCPWIYNCVGFGNYKFFFLLLFYAMLDTHLIIWTMSESVLRCINEPNIAFMQMFLIFFTFTLSLFLACLVTAFYGFHIWLMLCAMTTIEFCEKRLPKKDSGDARNYDTSVYDLGFCGNIRAVLGNNCLLWFFPCDRPLGDGLNFMSDETRLTKDLESGKGIRRRSHQRTQRTMRTPRGTPLLPGGYYSSMAYSGR